MDGLSDEEDFDEEEDVFDDTDQYGSTAAMPRTTPRPHRKGDDGGEHEATMTNRQYKFR